MKPHKHAEAIKAWADGAEIEYLAQGSQEWKPIFEGWSWDNWFVAECRIKPEPKPDVVKHFFVESHFWAGIRLSEASQLDTPVLSITFDGETGKLKSAEVI
jgi:hypothetical protein